ncbi:MAG: hypothetical protein RQ746_04020 [Bacteroidales bacterium]|nr:hypothetical protein [Bacteroidales bacterium]
MRPQDVLVLLKIINRKDKPWSQLTLADELFISQSEISASIARSKYADLLHADGKSVMALAFMEFLQFGIRYVFPVKPGPMVRGVPTSHSAAPLKEMVTSEEAYVWPSAKGQARGHSIIPLYPSVVDAVKLDTRLYEMLALVDALRVGKAREKEFAISKLKQRILHEG